MQRLQNLVGRLPASSGFRLGTAIGRAIQNLVSSPKIQHFLQTGRSAFEGLRQKYALVDPGHLPTLPFQPPEKVRVMLPTYPPRYIEVQPKLPPKFEEIIKSFQQRPVPSPEETRKLVEDALRRLQRRNPILRDLMALLRDFMTELGRHGSPLETGLPSESGSALHGLGQRWADSGASATMSARPKPDIDAQGPLLAAAQAPSGVSDVSGTPTPAVPVSGSVGEQIYGKAKDWSKDPANWPHVLPALTLVRPKGWDLGHVVTAVRVLRELERGAPKAFDIALKAMNVLKYILPPPLRQMVGSATDFMNMFKGIELADIYSDVLVIANKIQYYRQIDMTDPKEIIRRIREDLLDPVAGKWQLYGNLKNEDANVRFVRALTVYLLASGDEQLTGVPRR
ncbi:MAG: hypothetical protein NZ742_10520 [Acidobacteria bacterium]|nr:hypothetical protein [Acidobacteriota bacterium]MDW7985166.1 hypothetical protein [Acidobacteriota bacterium]